MVDMFPPHTQGIKIGNKNIIKHTPKKRAGALFFRIIKISIKPIKIILERLQTNISMI